MIKAWSAYSGAAALAALLLAAPSLAAPAIRTSANNAVPACVTPEKLMAFVASRNGNLDPRFAQIARWYKYYGEAWRVRWDYAFYQMVIETNALKFRRADGRRGDVHEKQNNFAGIGATGHGAPGDRFPDVKSGVHAQIQHLVAYSGEHVEAPLAPRTREKQDDIISQSRLLRRAVTFGDLSRRWASDRHYAKSIDFIADQYLSRYCETARQNADASAPAAPAPTRPRRVFQRPFGLGGPKDASRLAGPETLPWSGGPGAVTAAQAETADPAKPAKKPKSAVRTIWSRDGDGARDTAVKEDKENTGSEPPVPIAAGKPADTQNAVAGTEDPVSLPVFRIAPADSGPSHLGGPLPELTSPPRIAERLLPLLAGRSAHFREIIGAPEPSAAPQLCRVAIASYGGTKTLLVRDTATGTTRLTALTVLDGFEKSMFETYARANAKNAEIVGEYADSASALADARTNCAEQ